MVRNENTYRPISSTDSDTKPQGFVDNFGQCISLDLIPRGDTALCSTFPRDLLLFTLKGLNTMRSEIVRLKNIDVVELARACRIEPYTVRVWLKNMDKQKLEILSRGADEVEYLKSRRKG